MLNVNRERCRVRVSRFGANPDPRTLNPTSNPRTPEPRTPYLAGTAAEVTDGSAAAGVQIRDPAAVEGPRLLRHRHPDARPLHRRQRRHLRGRQLGAAAAAAGAARRAARPHVQRLSGRRPGGRGRVDRRSRLLRPSARDGRLPGTGALQHARRHARRPGRAAAHRRHDGHAVAAAAAAGPADPRPHLHRGRRGDRQDAQGGPDLRVVAAVVRRTRGRASARTSGSTASRTPSSACCRRASASSSPT